MTDNPRAVSGGNNPPDPIDAITSANSDLLDYVTQWLDGDPIETEDQMKEVDGIVKNLKAMKKELVDGQKSATAPLHDTWKAEIARWKPTIEDVDLQVANMVKLASPVKLRIAAEKEAIKAAAYAEARRKEDEARKAAEEAEKATDIEAARAAQVAAQDAQDAKKEASIANRDRQTGLRKVHKFEIEDHKKALHWIAANDRASMTEFIEEYVRKNHKAKAIDGVKCWEEKEAF